MSPLADFQHAAVRRIVERLNDNTNIRRFLLADEVGLGKTLVAKGVIEKLKTLKPRGGYTVIYLCANSEIAEQNRVKLGGEAVERLTLLPLHSDQIQTRHEANELQVFSLTPGTSFQVGNATGIERERRMLLYLLHRVWRKPVWRRRARRQWLSYFRCTTREDRWLERASFKKVKPDYRGKITEAFQATLKTAWAESKVDLNPPGGTKDPDKIYLVPDVIDEWVADFDESNVDDRRKRNRLIGALRRGLAIVALDFLGTDLVILDEFQRFKDIIDSATTPDTVEGKLFSDPRAAVLIMSATPYKMLTLDFEKDDHHRDFFKTIEFLRKEGKDSPWIGTLRDDLKQYRQRLDDKQFLRGNDPALAGFKLKVEAALKTVMSRTERNHYIEDAGKGVTEVPKTIESGLAPSAPELEDYIRLRRLLIREDIDEWNVMDYWKSSPALLNFMDGDYALIRRLRRNKCDLSKSNMDQMVLRRAQLPQVWKNNLKSRMLFDKVFGPEHARPEAWKYLWLKPAYTYYRTDFYPAEPPPNAHAQDELNTDAPPSKFLVFSHWRYVPKAISILVSQEIERQLAIRGRKRKSPPLQFRQKIAFYPFDVCYPSPVLARCLSQLELVRAAPGTMKPEDLYPEAEIKVLAMLSQAGIEVRQGRGAPLWQIIARLEARSEWASTIRSTLEEVKSSPQLSGKDTSEYFPQYVDRYLDWMNDEAPTLTISKRWLRRLTHIALFSPAVCTLRSLMSIFSDAEVFSPDPETATAPLEAVMKLCLNDLRSYFNKPIAQSIIRKHSAKTRSYSVRILKYCCDAHFQAVLDEYSYLCKTVLQFNDFSKCCEHLGLVFGMWSGTPNVNVNRDGRLSRKPVSMSAHFALSFGDDVSSSKKSDRSLRNRKTAVRSAFNSPFWPFVLATTSVGQEGLDFHLYCQDIVHWNLPSNPVDLEQREGRINRFDCLANRLGVRQDHPLDKLTAILNAGDNLWRVAYAAASEEVRNTGLERHGLSPHWIYQPNSGGTTTIRRHLLFYSGSRDKLRYKQLTKALSLYRLVLGQPRQQDILERLVENGTDENTFIGQEQFERYMINLSPIPLAHAARKAARQAKLVVKDKIRRDALIKEAMGMLADHKTELSYVSEQILALASLVEGAGGANDTPASITRAEMAAAALLYLVDPYDACPDRYLPDGLQDDIAQIRKAHDCLFPSTDQKQAC